VGKNPIDREKIGTKRSLLTEGGVPIGLAIAGVGRELLAEFGFTAHIRARGEEATALTQEAGFRARRRVMERTHRWMNRFRRVLIRWDKNVPNDLAFLHIA
jgi:hypothetical protein